MLKSIMELLGVSRKKGISSIKDLNKSIKGYPLMDTVIDEDSNNYLIYDSADGLILSHFIAGLRDKGDTVLVVDSDASLMKFTGIARPGEADLLFNPQDKRGIAWNVFTSIQKEWDIPRISKMISQHLKIDDFELSQKVFLYLKLVLTHLFNNDELTWDAVYTLLFKAPDDVVLDIVGDANDELVNSLKDIRRALFVLDDFPLLHNESDNVDIEEAIRAQYPGVIYFPVNFKEDSSVFFASIALDSLLYTIQNNPQEAGHNFWIVFNTPGQKLELINFDEALRQAEILHLKTIELVVNSADRSLYVPHELFNEVFLTKSASSLMYFNEDSSRAVLDPLKIKEEVSQLKPTEYLRLSGSGSTNGILYKGVIPAINSTGFKKIVPKEHYGVKLTKIEKYLISKEKPAISGKVSPPGQVVVPPTAIYRPPENDSETVVPNPEAIPVAPRTRFELPSSKRLKQQNFAKQASGDMISAGLLK